MASTDLVSTDKRCLIYIIGPTAVGKTSMSVELALTFNAEIISSDSRQMYRFMDIGTAKPNEAERRGIIHHFLDTLSPEESITAGQYECMAEELIASLWQNRNILIVAGGSTLYMDALWYGIDEMPEVDPSHREELQNRFEESGLSPLLAELQEVDPGTFENIDRNNHARVIRALEVYYSSGKPISFFRKGRKLKKKDYKQIFLGLNMDRELLYERINRRVDIMLADGLEAEVRSLLEFGFDPGLQSMQSIGYQEMLSYIKGEISYDEAVRLIKRNSRRYAKRQLTYYRRYPEIQWFDAAKPSLAIDWVKKQVLI